jgi:uncharacterized protein with NRDE domain
MLLAANRDEMLDRPWLPPGRHWPDRPFVVGGLDKLAGGSWFGLNDSGVAAGIMNRRETLGPMAGKRSRGELVLKALDYPNAKSAAEALSGLESGVYRAFNLVIADGKEAYWLRNIGGEAPSRIEIAVLAPGLSMITAYDLNDPVSPRVRRYLPLLQKAPAPDPDKDDWAAWERLLASRESDEGIEGAMNVVTDFGFGTASSLLLALPARDRAGVKPRFRFSAGRPDQTPYRKVLFS